VCLLFYNINLILLDIHWIVNKNESTNKTIDSIFNNFNYLFINIYSRFKDKNKDFAIMYICIHCVAGCGLVIDIQCRYKQLLAWREVKWGRGGLEEGLQIFQWTRLDQTQIKQSPVKSKYVSI
jgi:hypothetical protein